MTAASRVCAGHVLNIGALIIRIGFGGLLCYNRNKEPPQHPILIIKAPILYLASAVEGFGMNVGMQPRRPTSRGWLAQGFEVSGSSLRFLTARFRFVLGAFVTKGSVEAHSDQDAAGPKRIGGWPESRFGHAPPNPDATDR